MLLGYFFCDILTESGPNPGHILDLFHEYLQCILIHLENVFVILRLFLISDVSPDVVVIFAMHTMISETFESVSVQLLFLA